MLNNHPNHTDDENGIEFPGILVKTNFLDDHEASRLMSGIDEMHWDGSQSGRRKQVKCSEMKTEN